ncbi:HNH endonuclease [Pseudanabaena sp. FACHB-2040]|uniref:HNH endonuclease n=1 Tax=Pseudanabaena sp. FACHB-2040 TaxID=2692859 RepID=UPI0016867472|nr:HNH endonuclease [Pseudanabaena sp. FACHB-2040]
MRTIITENDESEWEDQTGVLYHFPKRYEKFLLPGTQVIYYKGKLKNSEFRSQRLADEPHYFAKAAIGKVYPDKQSSKGDLFAILVDYVPFELPVLAKSDNGYLESIPATRKTNYWRDGVRPIEQEVYDNILSAHKPRSDWQRTSSAKADESANDRSGGLESGTEGTASKRYVTTYERDPIYRSQAIAIHGTTCAACGFNFRKFYGEYGDGYIHIHHVNPVSEFDAPKSIDPETDLVPLCANCHSVVHRKKAKTLSLKELVEMIAEASNNSGAAD